jgi:hypothetical protein
MWTEALRLADHSSKESFRLCKQDSENRMTGSREPHRPVATYRHRRHDSSYPAARDAPVSFATEAYTGTEEFRSSAK